MRGAPARPLRMVNTNPATTPGGGSPAIAAPPTCTGSRSSSSVVIMPPVLLRSSGVGSQSAGRGGVVMGARIVSLMTQATAGGVGVGADMELLQSVG